jgi:hypothetical protein
VPGFGDTPSRFLNPVLHVSLTIGEDVIEVLFSEAPAFVEIKD